MLAEVGSTIDQIKKRPDDHFIVYLNQPANQRAPIINGQHLGSRAVKPHNHDVIEI
jgi:hypothetical protein|tara:strand:+ start:1312 stop:1479 length:168 start_codon:yes stop_codon:yes gene_type:complete